MDKDVPRPLDILANILQNSKFDDNRINHECNVILREMEEVMVPFGLRVSSRLRFLFFFFFFLRVNSNLTWVHCSRTV